MFRRKPVKEQRQAEFEKQCRESTREVINHRKGFETDDSLLYETVIGLNGNHVTRIRSALFYWCALISFLVGIYLLDQKISLGGFLILTLVPCLLLYPLIRFLFGGKDSVAGTITTFVVEEIVKREIFKALDDSSRKKQK